MLEINTKEYWDGRYNAGGNSGSGSYGRLAEFKAGVLNDFMSSHGITSMAELGCGDGNQLGLIKAKKYTGYDISRKAVELCSARYRDDATREFKVYDPSRPSRQKMVPAELAVSLDVVYHLLEDDTYDAYMRDLFALSSRFVAVYSCNTESRFDLAQHLRPHKFTDWVDENLPDWTLCGYMPNRYPMRPESPDQTSFADFYFFSRNEKVDTRYSCLFIPTDEAASILSDQEAAALMGIARNCLNSRELEKSAECLRQAALNRNVRIQALNGLGAVMGALGRHAEAEDAMKAALARDPANGQARINLTKLYLRLERWEDLNPFCKELKFLRARDPNIAVKWPHIAGNVANMA
jgi:tetratricopeptide (TPR) repeat protein